MKARQITAMVLAAVLVLATGAMAQGFGKSGCPAAKGCEGRGKGSMLDKLDLSPEQQAQVQEIRSEFMEAKQGLIEKKKQNRKRLNDAVHAPVYDEQAIRDASEALASDKEEMAVLKGQMFSRIRDVLTEEQLAKVDEMRNQRQERRDCRMRCMKTMPNCGDLQ